MKSYGTYLMFERLEIIKNMVQNGCFPTLKQIQQGIKVQLGIEISISSLNRDIAFLRTRANCPIEYDYFQRGYFLEHTSGGLL